MSSGYPYRPSCYNRPGTVGTTTKSHSTVTTLPAYARTDQGRCNGRLGSDHLGPDLGMLQCLQFTDRNFSADGRERCLNHTSGRWKHRLWRTHLQTKSTFLPARSSGNQCVTDSLSDRFFPTLGACAPNRNGIDRTVLSGTVDYTPPQCGRRGVVGVSDAIIDNLDTEKVVEIAQDLGLLGAPMYIQR